MLEPFRLGLLFPGMPGRALRGRFLFDLGRDYRRGADAGRRCRVVPLTADSLITSPYMEVIERVQRKAVAGMDGLSGDTDA